MSLPTFNIVSIRKISSFSTTDHFLRRYLKILLYIQTHIVIYKETSREPQAVGDSFVAGKKRSEFLGH